MAASAPPPPVYFGKPAVSFRVQARPLGFDADGYARWLLIMQYFDRNGKRTRIMANSDVDWISPGNYVQWQTRLRFEQPSAIIRTHSNGPIVAAVRSNYPAFGTQTVRTDTRSWGGLRVVVQAIGPHLTQIGWFPQETVNARVVRIDASGARKTVAILAGPSSTYRDTGVAANARYRYELYRSTKAPVLTQAVQTPSEPPPTSIANAGGKAMWLYFSTNPLDTIYVKRLDPQTIVQQAVRAGLHYVELRTSYGAYWQITPEAKPTIDAIVDGLAAHGIRTIAWSVPRDTASDDLAQTVRAAYYRTANGNTFGGVAIDLERGSDFMGDDPDGLNALWMYVQSARQALGPRYLIVSTIEDPFFEHLDSAQYPYAQIARFSDVLQPMAYWRMMRRKPPDSAQIATLLRASYNRTLALAGRAMPVSIGGETTAAPSGPPSAQEVTASLLASKQIGAIGECFFAWDGTQPYQWDAIGAFTW